MGVESSSCYGEQSDETKMENICRPISPVKEVLGVHTGSSESVNTPTSISFQVVSEIFPLDVEGFYGCNSPFSPKSYRSTTKISGKEIVATAADGTCGSSTDSYFPQVFSPRRNIIPVDTPYSSHFSPRTV